MMKEPQEKETLGRYWRSERKLLMNRGKRGIRVRGLQRGLSGRPRASRKEWSRAIKETWREKVDDRDVMNDHFTRSEGLVYAALRVWELKHGFGD